MTTSRQEDFESVKCVCGYSFTQQSGEMKSEWRASLDLRTAEKRS